MIRGQNRDDEIPLTEAKSTILQETKARFDTLLKTALSQGALGHQEHEEKNRKKRRQSISKGDRLKNLKSSKKMSKWKLSSSTQMLVSEEDHSSSSELNVSEVISDVSPNRVIDKASDFTLVSSSDELLRSPHAEKSVSVVNSEISAKASHVTKISYSSPLRPVPLPRRRQSTREESKDTTSSRVSSPDSMMTAIEAASPTRSDQGTSGDQTPLRCLTQHDNSLEEGGGEEYELKPLKGFSPSYEEIDETRFTTNHSFRDETNNVMSEHALSTTGLQNAASYEEIIEVDDQSKNDLIQKDSYQGTSIRKKKGSSRKSKQLLSSKKLKARDRAGDTDSSSSNRAMAKSEQSRTRGNDISSSDSDIQPCAESQYTYEKIIGVTIHRCDTLKIDSLIRHPMVRVHIIDTTKGEYLKKSQASRSVSFFQENPNIDYIQPLTSHPCSFKDPRSLIPIWEETLLFNEDIMHILQPHSAILFLFEILDFVSLDTAAAQYESLGSESGWHQIAWAFLKPQGSNNILNIDKKLRLQLYKPRFEKKIKNKNLCEKCDVYRWWSRGEWIQYPSSLHITVHSLPAPSNVSPALRSFFALQPEQCSMNSESPEDDAKNLLGNSIRGTSSRNGSRDGVVWSRLPTQSCKVPNHLDMNLSAGINGSFSIKFSHQGHFLAITAAQQNMHHLLVYRIPSGSEVVRFHGHPGLVYSLDWSQNDELLLSASADCTACVWSVKAQRPLQMLPHPSFVYCALFFPENYLSLVTGCCDHVIRIWRKGYTSSAYELQQELTGHEGYLSTLCTNPEGILFSGDSVGQIRMWQQREDQVWTQIRVLCIRELQGLVLSHLNLHPGGKRMLVVARDSFLRMVDIGTGVAIQWFKGALNHRIHSIASISPCGGYIFSPSEDSTFYVWNADTGLLVASYTSLFHTLSQPNSQTTSSYKSQSSMCILSGTVDYHPFEHMAAFAVYGAPSPVIVCKYARNSLGKDIGLQIKYQSPHEERESGIPRPPELDLTPKSDPMMVSIKPKYANDKLKLDDNKSQHDSDKCTDVSYGLIQPSINADSQPPKRKENSNLAGIIKQLDYVLQISRTPKQRLPGNLTPMVPSLEKLNFSPSSLLSNKSPSHNSDIKSKSGSLSVMNNPEMRNEVAYSSPKSTFGKNLREVVSVVNKQSLKEDLSSSQSRVASPVTFQLVQEKPPRQTKLRQKRSKRNVHEIKRKSCADLSTTDTSLLSSENEQSSHSALNLDIKSQEGIKMKLSSSKKVTKVNVESQALNSDPMLECEADVLNKEY